MSTANYRTMDNFSLFVREDQDEAKRCPKCGAIMDADATAGEAIFQPISNPRARLYAAVS